MKVILFPTCLVDLLWPSAAESSERVLARAGCTVEWREGAVCCGQPAWNSGHVEQARRVAAATLRALAGDETIVMCSGSCTTMVHEHWPELFRDTRWQAGAEDAARRARELTQFLVDDVGLDALGTLETAPTTVTYHDSCHMLRALGIKDAPRTLLGAINGLELEELDAPERCCGFGGTFSLRYPELSAEMADDKIDDATARHADAIVGCDTGCLMHICGRAEARGIALRGRYVAEVLDEAAKAGEARP